MNSTTATDSGHADVVLIHGLFLTRSSWENWVERYEARGLRVLAPAWPGLDGSVQDLRDDPTPLTKLDIRHVVEHFEAIVRGLAAPPIVMGHSFGGLIAQLLAYRGLGRAIVGIDSTAPAGVLSLPFSTLRASAPVLANPLHIGQATMLTAAQFRYAFTNTLSEADAQPLYDRYAIPCANRVLFEGAFENFAPHSVAHIDAAADRPPIMLFAGGADHLVTPGYTKSNAALIGKSAGITAFHEFPGRPHFTGAVDGWEEVADRALEWAQNPTPTAV